MHQQSYLGMAVVSIAVCAKNIVPAHAKDDLAHAGKLTRTCNEFLKWVTLEALFVVLTL